MRYILSHRRAGKFDAIEKQHSRESVAVAMNDMSGTVDIFADSDPQDPLARRVVVFDADPQQLELMAVHFDPDVIIEPEILFYYEPPTGYQPFGDDGFATANAHVGAGQQLSIKVQAEGVSLANARVEVRFVSAGGAAVVARVSDTNGNVVFHYGAPWTPSYAIVEPYAGYWTMVVRPLTANQTVDCPVLPTGPTGWWHDVVGASTSTDLRGDGVRIGVVDSGCGPHPALDHVISAGSFLDGNILGPETVADVARHGTHVCALIGSRPTSIDGFEGIAHEADLIAARVYPAAGVATNQGDIANAIEALSKQHQADLINLSLGTAANGPGSGVLQDVIADALERGTLCIAAAGNENQPQCAYPARFDDCVAISALGLEGWAPAGSLSSHREPTNDPARYGDQGLFLSRTSNHGTGLDGAGAGVGIVSAVPDRFALSDLWAVMDGTSMAAPVVCGVLANALSNDADYLAMPRNIARAQRARAVLEGLQQVFGFTATFAGRGIPIS